MTDLRIGSLFSGYGGLDLAVEAVLGATTAWVSDNDPGACKVLAHRLPGVPNVGDITKVDWSRVEPVDIITGGSPCQDLSHAGKRGGMTEGTRSNLWVAMRAAIAALRPTYVVWENVRGAYSAAAEGGPYDHQLCLCGRPDRRGGVHSPRHAEADLPRPSDHRDDGASTQTADRPTRSVRRIAETAPQGNGALGSIVDAADHGRSGCRAPDGHPATSSAQATPSRVGSQGGADSLTAGDVSLGSDLDTASTSRVRGVKAADARAEPQGSSCACPDCGGCLDEAHCTMEPCPGCMGGAGLGGSPLRALGRVLGDLSDLGYDSRWVGLRASDVGFAHGRFRVFVLAHARRSRRDGWSGSLGPAGWAEPADGRLLPTPSAADALGGHLTRSGARSGELLLPGVAKRIGSLLPTPRATDGTKGGPNQRVSSGDLMLPSAVARLLPTPTVQDSASSGGDPSTSKVTLTDATVRARIPWGEYANTVARQESVTRPAPPPTETAPRGGQRLSCRFGEWLMGLPDGWITDVPGITHNEALKLCGNGVVPQQAEAALRRCQP